MAAALKADVCEIFTDVDGVYTTDPNICKDAKKNEKISYEERLELATPAGRKAVRQARKSRVVTPPGQGPGPVL